MLRPSCRNIDAQQDQASVGLDHLLKTTTLMNTWGYGSPIGAMFRLHAEVTHTQANRMARKGVRT